MYAQVPLPYRVAVPALMRCFVTTFGMLARRTIHLPKEHVGMRVRFADGASARVYRETVVDIAPQNRARWWSSFSCGGGLYGAGGHTPLPLGEPAEHALVRRLPRLCLQAVDGQ